MAKRMNSASAKGCFCICPFSTAIVAGSLLGTSSTTAYVALGDLYARAGQGEYARSYYDAALQIDPQDAAALRAIAALSTPAQAASHTP